MIDLQFDSRELDRLVKKLDGSPEVIKEAKRAAFKTAADEMKAAVDSAIGGSGKVQSWQAPRVGSKGGYAAVSPKAKLFTEVNGRGKRYAVGYVTNAINSGHKTPSPSGKNERYRPRIKVGFRVAGRQFYQAANAKTREIAQRAVDSVVAALKKHLEE